MNNERVAQIKAKLNGLGTKPGELYTNREVVDRLKEFQNALLQGVYEKTHAERLGGIEIFHVTSSPWRYSTTWTVTFNMCSSW